MDLEGNTLNFFLVCENNERVIQLSEYYTVDAFKKKIHELFDIPPDEQVIERWKKSPESDLTVLKECVDESSDIISLVIKKFEKHFPNVETSSLSMEINSPNMETNSPSMEIDTDEDLEVDASASCIDKVSEKQFSVQFHKCKLNNAIIETCLAPLEKRKLLLLYLHNESDPFTSLFCENLRKPEITEILNRSFFILGWDVEETKFQSALERALNQFTALSDLVNIVNTKAAAAFCIVPIEDSISVFSCLRGKDISYKDFLTTLTNAEDFLITEKQDEETLEELKKKTGNKDDMGSENFQKLMADMLGDRDYDSFQYTQHEYLKKKIAFALLGPEKDEKGYEEKAMKNVDFIFEVILQNSNEIAKYKDKVDISFIYNCTEPLPSEKLRRAKKYEDYNPITDLLPLPIFVLRKCRGSANPCRVFVDHIGRTYHTWQDYIKRNKIVQSEMVLPHDGRYEVNENGDVLLDRFMSPDFGIDAKILMGADIASTVGGIVTGGIFAAAALLPVAPPLLIASSVVAVGVGIYSITRSSMVLYDRSRHKETLSFANSEARGAYLNIVAGSLGFVGVGASRVVADLASKGVNIGKGAGTIINTIAIANLGASGVSVLNSGHEIFDQWYNEKQKPSLLSILQLSSSLLFFGNAVYNFKTCATIVEESQARTLLEYQQSLRSNRHRKTFLKLLKETIHQHGSESRGKAEVISAIRNIQNKDDVFAVLTRSNKIMNKHGIKFSAVDGEIKLNGRNIDMNMFMSMDKKNVSEFLLNLPKSDPTPVETSNMRNLIINKLNAFSLPDIETLANYALRLLNCYNGNIKSKIISSVASVLARCTEPIKEVLDEIFPNFTKYLNLIDMVVSFFGKTADHLEDQYKMWMTTHEDIYYNPVFDYIDVDKLKRAIKFFEMAVYMYYRGTHLTEEGLNELMKYFEIWLAKQVYDYEERIERNNLMREHSATAPTIKTPCSICGGYYYTQEKKK